MQSHLIVDQLHFQELETYTTICLAMFKICGVFLFFFTVDYLSKL